MAMYDARMWQEVDGLVGRPKAHMTNLIGGADRETKATARARTVSTISDVLTETRSEASEASCHDIEHGADDKQDLHSVGTPTSSSASVAAATVGCDSFVPAALGYAKLLASALGEKPSRVENTKLAAIRFDVRAWRYEWRTALQLRGLCPTMCQHAWLEAFLEAEGLCDCLASVRSDGFGVAVVVAKSVWQAREIAMRFHGKRFAGSWLPVEVTFAMVEQQGCNIRPGKDIALGEPRRITLQQKFWANNSGDCLAGPRYLQESASVSGAVERPAVSLESSRLPLPQYFPFVPCFPCC
mmetsp:Transcript_106111/g.307003  ORF Transcript_106111/g.307003 Transcript_106111/m.307003 type:complete len:298 (-) Transcript_106111:102-995(-)